MNDSVSHSVVLRGPSCSVGRKLENNISFPNDKSISRQHATINVENGNLYVTDLSSKFGTQIGEKLCLPNISTLVCDGSVISFGATGCKLAVRKHDLTFCFSRLDKSDKECFKSVAGSIGFKIVKSAKGLLEKPE